MIRGKAKECPFGLPITYACKFAGGVTNSGNTSAISSMTPLSIAQNSDDLKKIIENNLENLLLLKEGAKCPFADRIFDAKEVVECKFDENQKNMSAGSSGLNGSPLYPQLMIGNMPQPQYGYPLEYYSDNNESRNIYYGIFSLIG